MGGAASSPDIGIFFVPMDQGMNLEAPATLTSVMARFYFHIREGVDLIEDDEGTDLPSIDRAREQAIGSARELFADAIKSGRELRVDAIVIADEDGNQVATVAITDVLPKQRLGGGKPANDDVWGSGIGPGT